MSVSSELYKVVVVGDGSTPSIAFNRKVFATADVKGLKYDTTTLAETALVNGTDFTVTGAGNESSGVTVTPASSIPTGTNWVIYTDQGATQGTDLTTAGAFPANTIEYMSDKLAVAIQEVEGEADRALKLPISDDASTDLPNKTLRASKYLGFDSNGDPTALPSASLVSNAVLVSVKDSTYGALGDGTTDDSSSIQLAIDSVSASGGGTLYFPNGTYRCQDLDLKNNVTLSGANPGSVTLKLVDGVDEEILSNPNSAVPTTIDYVCLENIIFDGNQANATKSVSRSAVTIDGCSKIVIKNCEFKNAVGYGLGLQAYPNGTQSGTQTDIYIENCHFTSNGVGSGGDTFDGIDVKDCFSLTMVNCTATSNDDRGFNIRGENINLIGCYAASNGANPQYTAGFEIVGNTNAEAVATTARLIGCESRNNGGSGFSFADGAGAGTSDVRVVMDGCFASGNGSGQSKGGIDCVGDCAHVDLYASNCVFTSNEYGLYSSSTNLRQAQFSNCLFDGNTQDGAIVYSEKVVFTSCRFNANGDYGVDGSNTSRTVISGGCVFTGNTTAAFNAPSNKRYHWSPDSIDFDVGSGNVIASAATVTLPEGGDVFYITGTTNITSITAGRQGRVVTLQFSGALTFTDGSNLALAGNFVTSSADTITLTCDGTNWTEISRSAN